MVVFPYLKKRELNPKSTKVKERPENSVEEAVTKCEEAFFKLEKYLHYSGFDSSVIERLSIDSLGTSNSFSGLRHCTQSIDYSSEMLDYSKEIENNLENLKKKISLYKRLESGSGKFIICAGISVIAGLIAGLRTYSIEGIEAGIGAGGGLTAAVGAITAGITAAIEKNIFTPLVQRSHYSPIENIAKYSGLFFYDLREKLKANE